MNQNATNDQERYERAKQRVDILRGFYVHAIVFVIVNLGLAAYNLATSPDRMWFIAVLGGWGIGLIAHGAYALGSGRFLGEAWQERKIREEMDREHRRSR
jgi:2TM domain-containing protein